MKLLHCSRIMSLVRLHEQASKRFECHKVITCPEVATNKDALWHWFRITVHVIYSRAFSCLMYEKAQPLQSETDLQYIQCHRSEIERKKRIREPLNIEFSYSLSDRMFRCSFDLSRSFSRSHICYVWYLFYSIRIAFFVFAPALLYLAIFAFLPLHLCTRSVNFLPLLFYLRLGYDGVR